MNAMDVATALFHACEGLEGWAGCQQYVAEGARFVAQSEPLVDIDTIEGYCEWMAGLGRGPLAGCHYELHSSAWDADSGTGLFFATFVGTHSGEGGPVPETGRSTHSHYVYAISVNDDGKVSHMVKVWNAPWALGELGWT